MGEKKFHYHKGRKGRCVCANPNQSFEKKEKIEVNTTVTNDTEQPQTT